MRNLFRSGFIISILIFFFPCDLVAQNSQVPAHHSVYKYLYYQKAAGNIPFYNHESLPISRKQVVSYLKEISGSKDISETDRDIVLEYLKEFDPQYLLRSQKNGIITGSGTIKQRLRYFLRSNDEPHIGALYDSTNNIYGAFDFMTLGNGYIKTYETKDRSARYYYYGARMYASIQKYFGVHFEFTNVSAEGNSQLLLFDEQWGNAITIIRNKKSSSYAYETIGTIGNDVLSFDVGSASLKIGPGISSPLILSENSPNMNWMRFNFTTDKIKYTAIHSSLFADTYNTEIEVGENTYRTRVAPYRYMSLHRFSVQPIRQIKFSFTEYIVYSNRELDFSKLNPVSPLTFLELDGQDRDNLLMSFDLVLNPFKRVEIFGTVLIDDLTSFSNLFRDVKIKDNDLAHNLGVRLALPYTVELSGEYTRIQPFVYTHWQGLNAVTNNTRSLGHYLGPNSDLKEFQLKKWFKFRTRIDLTVRFIRKGFNPIDQSGNVVENVGGDINLGADGPLQSPYLFLENADVNKWKEIEMGVEFEPRRGLVITTNYINKFGVQGNRVNSLQYFDFRFRVGF